MDKALLTLGIIMIVVPAIIAIIILAVIPFAKQWNKFVENISSKESERK